MRHMRNLIFPAIALLVVALASFGARGWAAQAAPASLQLDGLTLSGCDSSTLEGSYRLSVYDAAGNLLNDTTGYEVSAVFTTSAGVYTTLSFPHVSGTTYPFSITFTGTISTGLVYFYLTDTPGIRSQDWVLDCDDNLAYPSDGASGPDDRLNFARGDLINPLYARVAADGSWEIHVFTVDEDSVGTLFGKFTANDFEPYLDAPPAANTRIRTVSYSTLYALTTGEFQINVQSPSELKSYSIIFTGMPPKHIYYRTQG